MSTHRWISFWEEGQSCPRTPKDNAVCERFNRTVQEEFLATGRMTTDCDSFNRQLTEWLIEYYFRRPHASLGYVSPINFIYRHSRLLPMYPSSTVLTFLAGCGKQARALAESCSPARCAYRSSLTRASSFTSTSVLQVLVSTSSHRKPCFHSRAVEPHLLHPLPRCTLHKRARRNSDRSIANFTLTGGS